MTEQVYDFSKEQRQCLEVLTNIFFPFASRRRKTLYPSEGAKCRFVHYTTAENALKIIETKRLWMRSTMCMSDYREVDHGHDLLIRAFSSPANETQSRYDLFTSTLDACAPGVASKAVSTFNENWDQIRCNTYVTSLSEHKSGQEDTYGRLSMWRAFGGSSGKVALVISVPWFSPGAERLKLMFNPVAYFTEEEIAKEVDSVIDNMRSNAQFLGQVRPLEWISGVVYGMFLSAVTCLKHCGFQEEREWRVIHGAFPLFSDLMENSIECIGGVPQRVFKLPLEERISPEIDFSHIFDRLIIGPTQFPTAMRWAFIEKLARAGVKDPDSKVVISDIPIRT